MIEDQPSPTQNDQPAIWDLVIKDAEMLDTASFAPDLDKGSLVKLYGKMLVLANVTCKLAGHPDMLAEMRERDRLGQERYGTRLQPFNGRDPLKDAAQEALDLLVYLRQAIYERNGQ